MNSIKILISILASFQDLQESQLSPICGQLNNFMSVEESTRGSDRFIWSECEDNKECKKLKNKYEKQMRSCEFNDFYDELTKAAETPQEREFVSASKVYDKCLNTDLARNKNCEAIRPDYNLWCSQASESLFEAMSKEDMCVEFDEKEESVK